MEITHRTNEVDITINYDSNISGRCKIKVEGYGDFRHHLIEELLFLLADRFDLKDHLGIVISKLKVRLDLLKEVK